MKKIMKNLSKLFVLLLAIPIISISLSACKPSEPENPEQPAPETPIEEVDDNPNSPIRSGIYKFTSGLSLANMWYDDKDGNEAFLFNYLGARDRAGVRLAVEKMGFLDYCTELTTTAENLEKVIEFDANNVVTIYSVGLNGFYTKLSSFKYTYNELTELYNSAGADSPAIMYNEETGVLNLLFEFKYYKEEDTEKCKFHEIYIESELTYYCNSFESMTREFETTSYKLKENSAEIIKGENSTLSIDELNTRLAQIFNLTETSDAVKDVQTLFSTYTFTVNNEFTMSTIHKSSENELTFSFNAIDEQTFITNGIRFVISTKTLAELPSELTIYITLDEGSIFQFNAVKISV